MSISLAVTIRRRNPGTSADDGDPPASVLDGLSKVGQHHRAHGHTLSNASMAARQATMRGLLLSTCCQFDLPKKLFQGRGRRSGKTETVREKQPTPSDQMRRSTENTSMAAARPRKRTSPSASTAKAGLSFMRPNRSADTSKFRPTSLQCSCSRAVTFTVSPK